MKILTADEIKLVEKKCFDANYYNEAQLMEKAGFACYNKIVKKYGKKLINKSVAVFCGNGKNAGDGFVIARYLFCYGANAKIVLCDKAPTISEPLKYYNEAVSSRVPVEFFDKNSINADFIVDCIFGIGFHGEARAPFDNVFEKLSNSSATIISIDTPSGTNSTTGEMCKNAVNADYTVAISTLKFCHVLPPANALCGDIDVVDIGIPSDCYIDNYIKTIEPINLQAVDYNANKGSNGHLLCLCGSYNMPGAAAICGKSAIKSGAGLVKITTPKSAYPLVFSHLTQPIFNPTDDFDGMYSQNSVFEIINDLSWANAVALGCGMGVNDNTKEVIKAVLNNSNVPIILDADGINCINECINILTDVKVPVVLTPHPGEMSRLISSSVEYVQSNRIDVAKALAKKYGVIVALKGANTVVTDGETVFVNTTGNPAMAMAGTGDMLCGIIASLVAQGVNPYDAAKMGVYLHGKAGDLASEKISTRGINVDDMIDQLGALMS